MPPDDLGLSPRQAVPRDVRLALAYLRRAVTRRVEAAELAGICGVPERTLHRHFRRFLGQTPLVHFRHMRLAAAREALLAPSNEAVSVTEVATRFGFAHLGRFSSDFRRRFGEAPSTTLARGRASIASRAEPDADRQGLGWRRAHGGGSDGLSAPAPGRQRPSLVVLTFRTDPGEREARAFAEALAEQLTAALAQAHDLEVRLAPSAADDVARSGDRYCLTGRVMRVPAGHMRVVARAVDRAAGD